MPAVISCRPNCYGRFGARAALDKLPGIGLRHLELPIQTAGEESRFGDEPLVTTESSLHDLKTVETLFDRAGLRPASCDIGSGNPAEPDVLQRLKRKLDLASHFGVEVVLGEAGEADAEEQRNALYGRLRQLGDYAARLGITYCCQTHPGLCQNHRRMLETMGDVDHPHIRVNFDTANLLYYNTNINGEIALAKVAPYVGSVHLKDSQGEFGQWHFPALGYGGAVDFVRILEILRPTGFNGPYTIAIDGIAGEGELSLADYHRRVVASVEHLENCGYFD